MRPTTESRDSPYVGPRALKEDEKIFGRAKERADLRSLIVAHRVVLLYSPSGAGKTSLVEAGLRAELEQRDFLVLPTIRVGTELDPTHATDDSNRYRASVIASLDAENELPVERVATMPLEEYLTELDEQHRDQNPCFVFDQFEELFTLDPVDVDAKEAFLRELGAALRDRSRYALFAMREDFIARLDPYRSLLPTGLSTRFRLGLLQPDEAKRAAQGPARERGVQFDDDEAGKLVRELRRVQVARLGVPETVEGPTVEPVQLQVVCRDLWGKRQGDGPMRMPEGTTRVGVDNALRNYFEEEVAALVSETKVAERDVRQWFETKLISGDDYRNQDTKGPANSGPEVLEHLEDAHLIRSEGRAGRTWFELTHDRFVGPIRSSNRDFRAKRTARNWAIVGVLTFLVAGAIAALMLVPRVGDDGELDITDLVPSDEPVPVELDETGVARYRFEAEGEDILFATIRPSSGTPDVEVRLRTFVDGRLLDELAKGAVATTPESVGSRAVSQVASDSTESTSETIELRYQFVAAGEYVLEVSSTSDAELVYVTQISRGIEIQELTGEGAFGQIVNPADVRSYTLSTGDIPETVSITLTGLDTLSPLIRLFDDGGKEVARATADTASGNVVLVADLERAGTYFLQASSADASVGEFQLGLERLRIATLELADTGEATDAGEVDQPNREVSYRFESTADRHYQLTAVPVGDLDTVLMVTGPDGFAARRDRAGAGAAESLVVSTQSDGPVTVTVAGAAESTGSFEITVAQRVPTVIEVGTTANATLTDSGASDLYLLRGSGSNLVTLSLSPADGLDVVIEATRGDGQSEVANAGGGGEAETLVLSVADGDSILLSVGGLAGAVGDYSLTVGTAKGTPVSVGGSVGDSISTATPAFVYVVNAMAGEDLVVSLVPTDEFDSVLAIETSDGFVDSVDAPGLGLAEVLLLSPAVDGPVSIRVSGYQGSIGDFLLSVLVAPDDLDLSAEAPSEGAISDEDPLDLFAVDAAAGQVLVVLVQPDDQLDARLEILGPDGSILDSAQFGPPGQAEVLAFLATVDATYQVVVTGADGSTGGYTLDLSEPSAVPITPADVMPPAPPTEPEPGALTTEAPLAVYEFDAAVGLDYVVEVIPEAELDVHVEIIGPDGLLVARGNLGFVGVAEVVVLTPMASGQHRILVETRVPAPGEFALRLSAIEPTPLVPVGRDEPTDELAGGPTVGSIDASQRVGLYEVAVGEGQSPVIEVRPTEELDAVIEVIGPQGIVGYADVGLAGQPETVELVGLEPGNFRIRVTGYEGSTGDFEIVVTAGGDAG